MRFRRRLVMCLCLWTGLLALSNSEAHDSWLVADKTHVRPGETVRVAFVTSENFPISESATKPSRVSRWVATDGRRTEEIKGYRIEGDELVGRFTPETEGVFIASLGLHPRFIEIEAEQFDAYLLDEQAIHALESRKARGEGARAGREYYSKFATAIVCAWPDARGLQAAPAGNKIEIVAVDPPCTLTQGGQFRVRVLFDGRPGAGFHVKAGHAGLPPHSYAQERKTDSAGVATFELNRAGRWFVRTHAIRRIESEQGTKSSKDNRADERSEADWESFWASMTFEVAAAPGESGGR